LAESLRSRSGSHLQSTTQPNIPLTLSPKHIAARLTLAILAAVISVSIQAQQPRIVVFLDPAHGGPDPGAHLSDQLLEKDLTLAFAIRLRAILSANGFPVISTRDSDPAVSFTTDQRAEIADHAHPSVCLILHATASGNGVHLFTSELAPPDDSYDPTAPHNIIPWEKAQTASVPQSLRLANELGVALVHDKLPVTLGRASVRPLDNLTCPAVAIEIAPLAITGSEHTLAADTIYQQHIAQAIAAGLASWRTHSMTIGAGR
jgi:N-acetylmuramoyl-L-alanine amidase